MKRVRRNSMDCRNNFKTFTSELERCSGRLEEIVYELDQVCEGTRTRRKELPQKAGWAAAIAIAGGGLVGVAVALTSFTGDISLMALGIAVGAAAAMGAALAAVDLVARFQKEKISDEKTVQPVEKLIREFLDTILSLSPLLENLKTSLKDLNKDTEAVVRTQTQMQELSSLLKAFTTEEAAVERLLQVKEQCSRTLEELKKLKDE